MNEGKKSVHELIEEALQDYQFVESSYLYLVDVLKHLNYGIAFSEFVWENTSNG